MEDELEYFGRNGRNLRRESEGQGLGRNDVRASKDADLLEGRNHGKPVRISRPTPPPPPPRPTR